MKFKPVAADKMLQHLNGTPRFYYSVPPTYDHPHPMATPLIYLGLPIMTAATYAVLFYVTFKVICIPFIINIHNSLGPLYHYRSKLLFSMCVGVPLHCWPILECGWGDGMCEVYNPGAGQPRTDHVGGVPCVPPSDPGGSDPLPPSKALLKHY